MTTGSSAVAPVLVPVRVYVTSLPGLTAVPAVGFELFVNSYFGVGCSVTTSGGAIGGKPGGVADELALFSMSTPAASSFNVTV